MKAVVFIDVQNDFIDGALRNEDAIKKIPKIIEFAKWCVADRRNRCCLATMDTHTRTRYRADRDSPIDHGSSLIPADGYLATLEGERLPVEHCIKGTNGWLLNQNLVNAFNGNGDLEGCFPKKSFGSIALFAWALEHPEIDEYVLCGFCTDICVVSNALFLRAACPNTRITVYEDLCSGTSKEAHDAALKVMQNCMIDVKNSGEREF